MNTDALFIGQVIANLLATARNTWSLDGTSKAFDFVILHKISKAQIAINASPSAPTDLQFRRLKTRLHLLPKISKLLIVVPGPLPESQVLSDEAVEVVTLAQLPAVLDIAVEGDLENPKAQADLQARATLDALKEYRKVGQDAEGGGMAGHLADIDRRLINLVRQLPFPVVAAFSSGNGAMDQLRIGTRVPNVTVVLSDLVSFSKLVSASSEDVLNSHMQRYYRAARELVFTHGGMLDKFIGDAVLAVFGYPFSNDQTGLRVMEYATDLIKLGNDVLISWLGEINASVNTGTRVGIANGEIWPLNIGKESLELSFLGDTINLAARLESNCLVNGVLVDNRTMTQLANHGGEAIWTLSERLLSPENVKGQTQSIRAWQLAPIVA